MYNRKDHFYQKAKQEGFRSRAAYKLLELNDKYKLFGPSSKVLDLGAWPGGWLQVLGQTLSSGKAVGIDLVEIEDLPFNSVFTLTGDARDEVLMAEALKLAGGHFDLVLSDMAPKLSGIKEADAAACEGISELALNVSEETLNLGGSLVVKCFKGRESKLFVEKLRSLFNKVFRSGLDATRRGSGEYYVIAQGFKGKR